MEQNKEHKKGLIGTIIFHVIILLLLVFLGFFTPLPLPGEEGILVNFGDSENGFGDTEPSPARRRPQPAEATQQEKPQPQQEETAPPVTTSPPLPKTTTPKSEPAKEVAMTQDYEETAAIDAAEEKKREEEKKRQQQIEEERRKQQEEEDRLRKEEEDRIRQEQAEIERKKREEADRIAKQKALEEAARKKQEEDQRKINEINSRTKGAFSNSGSVSGGTGSGQGESQGVTFPGGNQGTPKGDPNARNYGQGGSGSGDQGSGVSFSLSGRSAISMPKPRYPGNDAGLVVVKVTVDKNGKVTGAEPGARGTTIMDQVFWNEAKQAALKAKFNVSDSAPAFQQGTITYRFVLD